MLSGFREHFYTKYHQKFPKSKQKVDIDSKKVYIRTQKVDIGSCFDAEMTTKVDIDWE